MSIKDKSKEYEDLKVNTSSKYYYQIKLSKDINNKLLNSDKVAGMLVLPTGGGKTRVAVTTAIDSAINNGYKVLWIAHRHMLLEQAEKTFQEFQKLSTKELSINVISGKHNPIESIDKKDNVIIIGNLSMGLREKPDHIIKKTLKNRVFTSDQKWLVIVDEAHHSLAKSYKEWIGLGEKDKNKTVGWLRKYREENIKILGLTATPNFIVENNIIPYDENRTRELSALYDNNTIGSISTQQLIDTNVLSRPNFITINTGIDFDAEELLSKVTNTKASLEDFMLEIILNDIIAENEERNQLIVKTYLNGADSIDFTKGQTLVFASKINNAMALREAFKIHNIEAEVIHSKKSDNDDVINKFRDGKIKILINVQILTEGSDIPEIENVFISRVTGSKVLFKQMVGRALRGLDSGGTATANIVTFKDNILNHHGDFFDTQKFESGLFEEQDTKRTKPDDEEEKEDLIEFSEDDLAKAYEKFIGLLDGDIEIPLVSAIPIGYYDLDEVEYKLNVYEHQLEYFIYFLESYNNDNSIINDSFEKIKDKYFDSEEMLFSITDIDIKLMVDYIRDVCIVPQFINFSFKTKLMNELTIIAEKTSDMFVLEEEFKNTTYAKDFYSIKQFVKECQDVARELRYGAEPLKIIPIKENEQLKFTFDNSVHNKEEIFKNASDKICKNLGIEKLRNSPDCFEWTKEAYKSYWGMAYYFADGFSKRDDDNTKIEINKRLQLKEIDSRVIESVVYHELLHTELENYTHDTEFKRYEAMFPDFEEYEHILYKIAMGQVDIDDVEKIEPYQDWSFYNKNKTYTVDEVRKILKENDFILPKVDELSELVNDDGKFYRESKDEKPIYFIASDLRSVYTQFRNQQSCKKDTKITLIVKKK